MEKHILQLLYNLCEIELYKDKTYNNQQMLKISIENE